MARCSRWLVLATLSGLPLLAWGASPAGTGAVSVALEYAAAPDCPDVDAFKAVVVDRLGYDAFSEGVPDRVLVRITPRGPSFEGRIEWRDADGRWLGDRTFPSRSNDCRQLSRAMAFALALQIQLSAVAGVPAGPSPATRAEPEAPAAVTPAPPAVPPPADAPPLAEAVPAPPPPPPASADAREVPSVSQPAAPPKRSQRPGFAVAAGATVGFGLSPSAVPAGRLSGSVVWPRWSLELAAELGWPATLRREDQAGFSHQELLGGLAICGAMERWSGCLLAKGGAIRIAGRDIDAPASSWGTALATGLRLAVMQPLGRRVYVAARVEGLVLLTRWRVTLDNYLVWTSPRFTESIGLDVGLRFP